MDFVGNDDEDNFVYITIACEIRDAVTMEYRNDEAFWSAIESKRVFFLVAEDEISFVKPSLEIIRRFPDASVLSWRKGSLSTALPADVDFLPVTNDPPMTLKQLQQVKGAQAEGNSLMAIAQRAKYWAHPPVTQVAPKLPLVAPSAPVLPPVAQAAPVPLPTPAKLPKPDTYDSLQEALEAKDDDGYVWVSKYNKRGGHRFCTGSFDQMMDFAPTATRMFEAVDLDKPCRLFFDVFGDARAKDMDLIQEDNINRLQKETMEFLNCRAGERITLALTKRRLMHSRLVFDVPFDSVGEMAMTARRILGRCSCRTKTKGQVGGVKTSLYEPKYGNKAISLPLPKSFKQVQLVSLLGGKHKRQKMESTTIDQSESVPLDQPALTRLTAWLEPLSNPVARGNEFECVLGGDSHVQVPVVLHSVAMR